MILLKNACKKFTKKVICNHDVVALGMMNAFHESGIVIGEDIQIFARQVMDLII
ncbi:hypothetical protein I4O98_017990 [Clostridioides difficile]